MIANADMRTYGNTSIRGKAHEPAMSIAAGTIACKNAHTSVMMNKHVRTFKTDAHVCGTIGTCTEARKQVVDTKVHTRIDRNLDTKNIIESRVTKRMHRWQE